MTERQFPDWEQLYQEKPVETMPWFHSELDADLDRALNQLYLKTGNILDLGTGPGTQAMALAERGFRVTATDLSETAIAKGIEKSQDKGLNIIWQQDDILNSSLDEKFDFILDRGCFHVLPPKRRQDYVTVVGNLIKPSGYLFLKCFSVLETREEGPYRFTPEEIQEIFQQHFTLISAKETVYQGTLEFFPKALFCILQKS
jgi:cyclopropane fatty-acyl-phospholipid synthase-like methyltransferase